MDICIVTALLGMVIAVYFVAKFCLFSEKISGSETDSRGKR